MYMLETVQLEKSTLLGSLACSRNDSLLHRYCYLIPMMFFHSDKILVNSAMYFLAFCNRPLIRILFDAKMFQSFFPQYQKDVVVVASFSIFYSKNGP